MIILGSDYSKHNGDNSVVSSDEFAIIRAGYGKNNIDKKFKDNVEKCKKRGIPYGVYWFSYCYNEETADNEAIYCVSAIESVDYKPLFPLYYDNEYDSNDYHVKKTGKRYNRSQYNRYCDIFCKRVESLGYFAGIYVNKDYLKNYLDESLQDRYSIWLADYSCGVDMAFKGRKSSVHVVQYTNTPWDKNVCRLDFPNIIRNKHLNGW